MPAAMTAGLSRKPRKVNFSDMELRQNPAVAFGKLLQHGPVFRGKLPVMGRTWFVTRHAAALRILRDTGDFVREPRHAGRRYYWWLQSLMPAMFRRLSRNMLALDGEDHRRLRTLVDAAFQRQSIDRMEDRIREITRQHLDRIESSFRSGHSQVDFLPACFRPVPLAVICELLGLPESDRSTFMSWFSGMSQVRSSRDIFRLLPMMRRTMKYLESRFQTVRRNGQPGLIRDLVQVEADGHRLSRDELLSTAMLLLLAGHETTVHLISNSLLTLLQFDDARRDLLDDWSMADSAIDEILRWTAVVHITKPRFVARDMEFYGQSLSRGELIIPVIGCANFDPAEFHDPDQFLIRRSPNRHLTFGNGPHVCLGMKLAKAETRIVLQEIFDRWPGLSPAFDLRRPPFGKRIGMRTLDHLPLRPLPEG
jgi:cytochrome P450